ncbi:DUF3859 domain-containing protein [Marinilabiliaceae bacterium JC017]|nr:DUF3859 domain-containing protein [Marinilabiliaceae bacterium JC017]
MKETPLYERLFKELLALPECDNDKFTQLYEAVKTTCQAETEGDKAPVQKQFQYFINRIINRLPFYFDTLRMLVEGDNLPESLRNRMLTFLDTHYGPDSIHRIAVNLKDRETLEQALDKMYNNLFDRMKRYQLMNCDSDEGEYIPDEYLAFGGGEVKYIFEVTQADGTVEISNSDAPTELRIFEAMVADEALRDEVVKYVDLINAIHYSLGSESDIRYDDQRIIFEAPMVALLKHSAEYIPLLCECYAVFDKWHDVSAFNIATHLLPRLHPDAPEMIYLYAAAYGRALGNYELVDTFENTIGEHLADAAFREQFVKLMAADSVAAGIAMDYEHLHQQGDDLREEMEVSEWDEEFDETRLGIWLKSESGEEAYERLKNLYNEMVEAFIDGDQEAPIRLYPHDLAEITGVQLNERGDVKRAITPCASLIYNSEQAAFFHYYNKEYLLTCDEGTIRIVDFEKKEQFTVRNVVSDEAAVDDLVVATRINDKSPVHFVSYSNGIIQGWHMGSASDTFRIRANVKCLFLTEDGSQLTMIVDEEEDYAEEPITDGRMINFDLSQEKTGTVLTFNLDSLTETGRWFLNMDKYEHPTVTRDGKYLFALKSNSDRPVEQMHAQTGTLINRFQVHSDNFGGIMNMAVTPDSKKLIVDTNVYTLPEMELLTQMDTYMFGDAHVSADSTMMAVHGEMANTEFSFAFSDLNSGKLLGHLFYEEDSYGTERTFFSPCGTWFCSIINDDLHIWNLKEILAGTPHDEMTQFEIEFPDVQILMLNGTHIMSVSQAKGNFINETKNPRFTLLEHGLFQADVTPAVACEGRQKETFANVMQLSDVRTFIPQPGMVFGVKLQATPQGLQQFFDVKVRIAFPERLNPETGEMHSEVEWYQQVNAREPLFLGYQFTNETEFKPGTWMIEVSSMEEPHYLFRRLFYIEKPFEAVDYTLNKTFCGLYSDPDSSLEKISESRTIAGKAGITFGLQFSFTCPELEEGYKIIGEMEHPPMHDLRTGELKTMDRRKFTLRDGNRIGFFRRFNSEEEVTEGKWLFRLIDPGLNTVIMEEELEIVPADQMGTPEFELLDSGVYTPGEAVSLYKNYPKANVLELASNEDTIVMEEKMVFGFRYRFNNLAENKRLAVMVYHPTVKSMFGDETEEDFTFDVGNDAPQFIGWVMERSKYLVEGEWCFKVWEDEIQEDETPLFEKTFVLK